MRLTILLLVSCVLHAQTGKPAGSGPIKDPQQAPGKAHPGPIPRETPQPSASAAPGKQTPERKTSKKTRKPAKQKVTRSEQ
jgi:hypothetical protein